MKNMNGSDTNSKKSKLTEKMFIQSIVTSVLGILLCMVALCSVTWAWYTVNTGATSNITAANCYVSIEIKKGDTLIEQNLESAQDVECNFAAGEEYIINLKATGTASLAYCIIYIGDVSPLQPYYTEQIAVGGEGIAFKMKADTSLNIKIRARWGISSQASPTFENNGAYSISNNSVVIELNG